MAILKDLIVNGGARILNGLNIDTINGVAVGSSPKFTDTTYTAATAAPGNVAASGAVGTSTNYARQDHTHGIALATGDSNGQVKIAGSNVSVKGLGTAAYKTAESVTTATLAVASWSNGVYSFTSTYPNASYDIAVEPDGNSITAAQYEAWVAAKIVGNSASNTIKALGTVPTVAIPVVIRVMPK